MMDQYREYVEILHHVWPDWELIEPLGSGSFAIVFRASRKEKIPGDKDSAIKIIRIPHDPQDWERMQSEGNTEEQTKEFFQEIVNDSLKEIRAMEELCGHTNIVSIFDYKRYHQPDQNTWYILIRMELLQKLDTRQMDEKEVIRLGIDICTALSTCRKKNIVHRDVSLDNIFVRDGNYKLGDFGVSKVLEGSFRGISSVAGKPLYMAPEVYNASLIEMNIDSAAKVDIYSLGILMYRLCHGMHYPFENPDKDVTSTERNQAFKKRVIDGEPLPPPHYASRNLAEVILKACEPKPENRYENAEEMKLALLAVQEQEKSANPSPAGEGTGGAGQNHQDTQAEPERKKPKWIAAVCCLLAIGLIGFGAWKLLGGGKGDGPGPESSQTEQVVLLTEEPTAILSYSITWQDDDGKTIDTNTVEYGTKPTHADPAKEADREYTYTFSGWEPAVAEVTGDATYKATYKRETRTYTITWQDDAGNMIDTIRVTYGTKPAHADPTKEADQEYTYSFSGWEPVVAEVTGDATYKATFRKETRSYSITWQDDAGNTIDTVRVTYGTKPAHTEPVKEADQQYTYTFSGWEPAVAEVTGDATYKAAYKRETRSYTIVWQDDAGKTIDTTSAAYGTKPAHTEPAKEADQEYTYTFSGWEPAVEEVTGDAAYKATYSKATRSYTITWQDEDGKTIDTAVVSYGTKPVHADPAKEADQEYTYTFSGWEPAVKEVTGDATYKATFRKETRSYTITWQDDGGKTIDTAAVAYGTKPVHADPAKEADREYTYTFSGWEPAVEEVTGDAIYKATYKKATRSYTITWQDDDGKTIDTAAVAYGTKPAHAEPAKEADREYTYSFSGWEPAVAEVTGDAIYKATYKKATRSYTITWQDDAGNIIDTASVKYGTKPAHADPAKEADQEYTYTFSGWEPAVAEVTEDATYKAVFRKDPIIKESWICTDCQAVNTFDDFFCTNCGQTKVCLECGQCIPKADDFCFNCATAAGKWKCRQCGELGDRENLFCVNCGTKRHKPGAQ